MVPASTHTRRNFQWSERISGECLRSCLDMQTLDMYADGRLVILENIACALWYLHAHRPNIIHGDIKDSNIMVERWADKPRARLLDFGLSMIVEPRSSLLGASWRWAAPECLLSCQHVQLSSDVFSFGRLLHRVLIGQTPLAGISMRRTVQTFAEHGLLWTPAWHDNTYLRDLVGSAQRLSQKCLMVKAEARPSIRDVHQDVCSLQREFHATPSHTLHTEQSGRQQLSMSFDPFD